MAASTLVWTALPAGIRRDASGTWVARVSVFVAPRLAPDGDATLADFPALVDWPATLANAGPDGLALAVSISDGRGIVSGQTLAPISAALRDSTAWRTLLPADTPVRPVPDPGVKRAVGAPVSYPAADVLSQIRRVYAESLPDGGGKKSSGALRAFAAVGGVDTGLLGAANPALAELAAFLRPADKPAAPLRTDTEDAVEDLHRIVAGFGGHPMLLRLLGLVLDVEIDVDALALDSAGDDPRVAVAPVDLDAGAIAHECPWTAIEIGAASSERYRSFCVRQRDGTPHAGLHALPESPDNVAQEKLEHAFGALVQHATTIVTAPRGSDAKTNTPPALLQVGMRMLDDAHAGRVAAAAAAQGRIADSLAGAGALLAAAPGGDAPRAAPPPPDTPPLFADQLTRGYRIDVQDADDGPWRSLCRRRLRYRAGDWAWPERQIGHIEDEGTIEPTVYDDDNAAQARFRIPPELFTWDGWSLTVPHPDEGIGDTVDRAGNRRPGALDAVIEVPPGSLQPQRFGRRYRFRARGVDLAGNSLSTEEADALLEANAPDVPKATRPTRCLRVENAQPPVSFPAQPRGWGESGDVIVVRDAEDARYRTDRYRLHLLPPPASVRIAERHGLFDGMTPDASWQLLQDNRGTLERDDDGNERDFIPDATLYTPYLPDPAVRAAIVTLPDGTRVGLPRFDRMPSRAPAHALAVGCALLVERGDNDLGYSMDGRTVQLRVPRGRVTELQLAAQLDADTLAGMALASPEWTRGHATDALAEAAAKGRAPALAPSRTLRILHATQRPLTAPVFVAPALSPRPPDSTAAVLLDEALLFDGPSSGRIDVYASWRETVDDPATPAWRVTENRMLAGGTEIRTSEPTPFGAGKDRRPALEHDFGDTRHRVVTYRALATSRFTDFFPPSLTRDADNITREGPPITLHVPSTAPPDPPSVAYVLPTFARTTGRKPGGTRTSSQQGFGLRVYLQRGWFSSGEGEQLAIVLAGDGVTPAVSEWGTDPTIDTADLPGPLGPDQVTSGTGRIDDWPLTQGRVVLAPHDVAFGEAQGLPFADIEFASQASALPLVRLAVARYQAHAIDGCHLSPIVHADFVPLAPDRHLTVLRLAEDRWKLALYGQGYKDADGKAGTIEAAIEHLPIQAPADDAAWIPAGESVTIEGTLFEDYTVGWTGEVALAPGASTGSRWRRRLVIREHAPGEPGAERRLLGVQTVAL